MVVMIDVVPAVRSYKPSRQVPASRAGIMILLGVVEEVLPGEEATLAVLAPRLMIEKPFGHSLNSARELSTSILRTLHEDQIFRIDHFLGKTRSRASWRSVSQRAV